MTRLPLLHLVTDDRVVARADFPEVAAQVLEAGGSRVAFHLRAPGAAGRTVFRLARTLEAAAASTGSLLLVNDRVDVAMALGIGGIQLGGRSLPVGVVRGLVGPEVLLGVSVHSPVEARRAEDDGADFLLLGTLFPTPSHPGRPGGGATLVREVGRVAGRPLVGIGGVSPERIPGLLDAGLWGAAVLRGVWDAADSAAAVRDHLHRLPDPVDTPTESKRLLDGINNPS